jgi:putative phosphoesterase
MKILIVSDIHGNLPAIETLLKMETDWDQIISLGDVVNYGPWSNECVDLLEDTRNCIKLSGNHESYFINRNNDNRDSLAYSFFEFCLPQFERQEQIKKYEERVTMHGFTLQHTLNNRYIYPDTALELDHNYFIGHSHRQFRYTNNLKVLVNPGSVGQNRQFINSINYALWNTVNSNIELKNIIYDVSIVINEMKKRNYPGECIAYYTNKPLL